MAKKRDDDEQDDDEPTISDLTEMFARMFGGGAPPRSIPTAEEALAVAKLHDAVNKAWLVQNEKQCCSRNARDFAIISAPTRKSIKRLRTRATDASYIPMQLTVFSEHEDRALDIVLDVESFKRLVNAMSQAIALAEKNGSF